MAFTKLSMAQHVVAAARKSYLTGVASGVAFRLQGLTKAVEARDLIDKAAGEVDTVTRKAIKSLTQAISNQWAFAGEVLAKLTVDERKAIKLCGDNGALERIVDTMESHMAAIGFNSFTLADMRDFYSFNSADEIAEFRVEQAVKEAAAETLELLQERAVVQAAVREQAAQGRVAEVSERDVVHEAMAMLHNANSDEVSRIATTLLGMLSNVGVKSVIASQLETLSFDDLSDIGEMVASRKATITMRKIANGAARTQAKLAAGKAVTRTVKAFSELAVA